MGVSPRDFPTSVEALLRRALRGTDPLRINPLVDLYTTVSLRHVVPAGGFDLGKLRGDLDLRMTRAGDRFLGLDAAEAVTVPAGEVAYTDGAEVLTRHFVWRQSKEGLIDPQTRDVILLAEILGELEAEVAGAVEADLRTSLERRVAPEWAFTAILGEDRRDTWW